MLKRHIDTDPESAHSYSDEELLQSLQDGEGEVAFSQLVQRHNQRFYGLAYRIVGRKDVAEDIVQEAFIRLWRDPYKFSGIRGAKFTTWFYRIVTNLALDVQRRDKRRSRTVDVAEMEDLQDESLLPDQQRQLDDISAGLQVALRKLPLRQQVAIELHYFDSLSQRDAAYVMQLSEKAYQSLLHRGKQQLKRILPSDMLVGTS